MKLRPYDVKCWYETIWALEQGVSWTLKRPTLCILNYSLYIIAFFVIELWLVYFSCVLGSVVISFPWRLSLFPCLVDWSYLYWIVIKSLLVVVWPFVYINKIKSWGSLFILCLSCLMGRFAQVFRTIYHVKVLDNKMSITILYASNWLLYKCWPKPGLGLNPC